MDIANRPFSLRLKNVDEIRMGSPYRSCEIEIIGFAKFNLPRYMWQDKYAWSDDSKSLVLVKWNYENNEPSFHLVLINTETGEMIESPKIFGLPNDLSIEGNRVKLNKFLYDKQKSEKVKLCCHVDDEYEFSLTTRQ